MVVLLLSSAAIIILAVANVGSGIVVILSPSLLGSSALMPFVGFLLGYVLSAVFKLNDRYVPPLPPSLTQKNREVQQLWSMEQWLKHGFQHGSSFVK